jgi:hypothetical protein
MKTRRCLFAWAVPLLMLWACAPPSAPTSMPSLSIAYPVAFPLHIHTCFINANTDPADSDAYPHFQAASHKNQY